VINPAGIKRHSGSMESHFIPLEWVSKYGSATVNLAGPDHQVIPQAVVSGLNQFGLSASFNLAKGQPVKIMSMTNDFIGDVENHF
jgi:hypothetical protein